MIGTRIAAELEQRPRRDGRDPRDRRKCHYAIADLLEQGGHEPEPITVA